VRTFTCAAGSAVDGILIKRDWRNGRGDGAGTTCDKRRRYIVLASGFRCWFFQTLVVTRDNRSSALSCTAWRDMAVERTLYTGLALAGVLRR